MDGEILKRRIGTNIALQRKQAGLTQAGLAAKLNYSDKAVSKWERGESVPDMLTMVMLAEQFDISVNDLLVDPNALPEDNDPGRLEAAMTKVSEKTLKRKANKNVILALSTTLVWFVALFVFVITASFDFMERYSPLPFVYAVPITCIVLLSLRSAWRDFRWNKGLITGIVWGCLASIYLSILIIVGFNFWRLYLLGIPGQLAIELWFRLFSTGHKHKKKERNDNEQAGTA